MITTMNVYTIHKLTLDGRSWITTDITEMVAFCKFLTDHHKIDVLGQSDPVANSFIQIPLTCIS